MSNGSAPAAFREHIRLARRAMRTMRSITGKPIMLSRIVSRILDAVYVFPNLYLSALIVNELAGARNVDRIVEFAIATVAVNGALLLLRNLAQRWTDYHGSLLWQQIEASYAAKLFSMDYRDIEDAETHQLVATIKQNANWGGWGLYRAPGILSGFVSGTVKILCSAAFCVSLFASKTSAGGDLGFLDSAVAAIVVIATLSISVVVSPILSSKANTIWAKQSEWARLGNRLFSFYGWQIAEADRAKDVRIYRQDEAVRNDIGYRASYWSENFRIANRRIGVLNSIATAITYLAGGVPYLYVALKALGGAFDVGSVVMYVGAIMNLTVGVGEVLTQAAGIRDNNTFLRKVFEFLDFPNRMYQGTLSVEKREDAAYEIEFRDVSFKYPNTDEWALRHVNFKFRIGEHLAIVGKNGSGKTTFIKLLCRLYDPTEGEILLNDFNIRKYDYREYLDRFAVVFQDFKLFSLPLGQNVAAAVEYDHSKAEISLSKAGFESRLSTFPHGLETYLNKDFEEDGVEISGGEAQKIALARALYKEAPIVILDEPTAALDPKAEFQIYSRFNKLVGSRTAVFISHRLASCRFCDDIAVFDRGSIVQRGSHEELVIDSEGTYHALWTAQADYYT